MILKDMRLMLSLCNFVEKRYEISRIEAVATVSLQLDNTFDNPSLAYLSHGR
jgi:hypothetical protein